MSGSGGGDLVMTPVAPPRNRGAQSESPETQASSTAPPPDDNGMAFVSSAPAMGAPEDFRLAPNPIAGYAPNEGNGHANGNGGYEGGANGGLDGLNGGGHEYGQAYPDVGEQPGMYIPVPEPPAPVGHRVLEPPLSSGQTKHTDSMGSQRSQLSRTGSIKKALSMKQFMGVEEANERIDIKATLDKIERWPVIKKGYSQLATFLVFFGLYCCVMMLQLTPDVVYRVDDALRNKVVAEGDLESKVTSLGDMFDYLNDQIMPNVFPATWYNDDPYTTTESGYLLDYNRLVGGLLIVQGRGTKKDTCVDPMYNGSFSSYEGFYPICYSQEPIEMAVPEELRGGANNAVPWSPGVAAPPQAVNDTRTDGRLGSFWESFTYSSNYSGFACWLAEADGSSANLAKVEALKKFRWLDKYTRTIDIKFAIYNGYFNMFTFVKVSFQYALTGSYIDFGRAGGTKVKIRTINMEPYRIGPGQPPADTVRLALEVILMVWIFDYVTSLIREGLEIAIKDGWSGKKKRERATGKVVEVGGLKNFLFNPWTIIDMANYGLFIGYIIVRIQILQMIYNEENIIRVPTNKYHIILEDIATKLESQLFLNFFNILLCLIRCFKFYRFQPRLSIINKTLEYAFPDLYHFILMFITVLFGFAVMSHCLFGPQLWQFATLTESLNSGWMWMNGGSLDYAEISYVDGAMAAVYYITFILIMYVVLLNVLLAILVDSYAAASEDTLKDYDDDPDKVPSLASDLGLLFKHAFAWGAIPNETLSAALVRFEDQEMEFCTVAELYRSIPEKIRDSQKITEETIEANANVELVEIEPEQERQKHEAKVAEELMEKFASSQHILTRQDKMELALLSQIDELARENEFLKRKHAVMLAKRNAD